MQSHHKTFLLNLDANQTPHSGRVLYDHLKGVHDLLRDWDNGMDVCMAGLFHSIYGTSTFKHQSLKDRGELIKLIGVKAELLVHYFATKTRPMFEDVEDEGIRKQLMEIEAANLLEQGSTSRNWLNKLARQKLSDGARAGLHRGMM